MKKTIAVLMLGSALLLPNNTSVEASYSDSKVQVPSAQQEKHLVWGDYIYKSYFGKYFNDRFHFDWKHWEEILGGNPPSINKPGDTKPEEPCDTTPEKPGDTTPEKPGDATPEKPGDATPEKPGDTTPEQPGDTTPEQPGDTTPEQPGDTTPEEPGEVTPEEPGEVTPEEPGEVTPEDPGEVTPEEPGEVTPGQPGETPEDASISAIEQAVLDLTNAERQKAGLKPLQIDKNLMSSARQKSTDMATNNYFSHTSPTYGSPFDQMKANGVTYKAAAENIAMGQRTAEEVVKGWMASPGHRENILTPGYTHIGIGYDKNGNYWTQQFIQK
ncbi:CAP domain-containing protein [Sporosarcina sp. NPDC096371]|uniref:CAP domain-containing protein n=1 Tax=Sporosarcina sp. NPDC096371 TaxID=3364530 RepID=UPI0038222AF9